MATTNTKLYGIIHLLEKIYYKLSKSEVGNLQEKSSQNACCIVSRGQTTFFQFLCGDGEYFAPYNRKMIGSVQARLHDVAIKKIIDGNLTVLGHIP